MASNKIWQNVPKIIVMALVMCAVFIAGCGKEKPRFTAEQMAIIPMPQKTNLPVASGGFVLSVGNETVTYQDVIEPLKERATPIAKVSDFDTFKRKFGAFVDGFIINKIADILLYEQAKDKVGDNVDAAIKKAVDAEVRKFLDGFNGDWASAENALKKDGMDWPKFRRYQKKMILSQSYLHSELPDEMPVTYSQLKLYYDTNKDKFGAAGQLKFQLIDINSKKLKEPNQSANELAQTIMEKIKAGGDFGKLAKEYSNGYRASLGGLWKTIEPGSLAKPYEAIEKAVENIAVGEVIGPVTAEEHIFIIKLLQKEEPSCRTFNQVQKEIESVIKFQRKKDAIDDMNRRIVARADLSEKDIFVNYCLERLYVSCQN